MRARIHAVWPFLVAAALAPSSAAAAPTTVQFDTPGAHDWIVPAGVDVARVELIGGEGGAGYRGDGSVPGGKGARVVGNLAVTPGETLSIVVAGAGSGTGAGGYGGGGAGGSASRDDGQGAGGGGASSVGRGANALMVAGGGGGGGAWGGLGGAGGLAGADDDDGFGGKGGGAGTASAGGARGAGGAFPSWHCSNRIDGLSGGVGSPGVGGTGGATAYDIASSGGGGGGGWFGGGGGGSGPNCLNLGAFSGAGGGGGGSSHLDDAVAHGTIAVGDRTGNGIVTILFGDDLPPVASPQAGPAGWSAEDVSVSWNWADVGGAGIDAAACPAATTSAGDGVQTLTATCADTFGNVGEASHEVKVDTTPPEIEVDAPVAGEYRQGDAVTAAFTCTDATSGLASCVGSTANGAPLDTAAPGEHRLTVTATDVAGNETTADVDYTVVARPAEAPPADAPPAETPPSATAPVASRSVPPSLAAPRLLVFRPAVAIDCQGADTCRVIARRGGRALARGSASDSRVSMRLTAWGRRVLARQLGGASVRLHAVATSAGERRSFTLRRRAVLGVERAVTPPGSFVRNTARLTAIGRRFATRLRTVAQSIERARCDGFAAGDTLSRTNAYEVSLERARRICGVLGAVPTRSVGHGTLHPRVDDRTESGRAVNRRVVVTLRHTAVDD
jgi:hypothetical protein